MSNELIMVHPDGRTTKRKLSPEQLARLQKRFLERFDPETLESRSIQRMRKRAERK